MDLLARMATFVRIVEVGSFSAAAKQLRLSVAAVSRHVSALEAELGSALIVRTTRKLTITPSGRLYYERCLRVLRDVEDAQTVGRLGAAGPLRMSVPVSLGVLAGDTLVYSLLAHHRGLRIELRVEDHLVDLAFENVDIAIRIGAGPPNSSDVVAVPLATWTRVLVASPAYIARRGEPKRPQDLPDHDVLSTAGGAVTDAWSLVESKTVVRVRFAPRFSTNAGQLLHAAALEGHGIALLPDWFVADDLKARRLVRLLRSWTAETTSVHALYRATLRGEQRVRTVVDHLRRAFSDGSWRKQDTPRTPRRSLRG